MISDMFDENFPLQAFPVTGANYFKDNIKSIMKKSNPAYSQYVYRVKEEVVGITINKNQPDSLNVFMEGKQIGFVPFDFVPAVEKLRFKKRFVATILGGDIRLSDGILEQDFKIKVDIYDYN